MELIAVAEDKSKIALTDLLRLVMMHDHSAAHALHRHWDKLEVSIMGYLQCFDLKAEDSLAGVDYLEMLRRFQEGREALGLARFEVVPYMMRHTGVSEDLAAALRTLRGKKYPVVEAGGKCYCSAEHAAVVWPKWKKYWQKRQKEEKS